MKKVTIKNLDGVPTHQGFFNTQEEADSYISEHSGGAFGLLERLKPTVDCSQYELDIAIGTEDVEGVEHKRLPQMFTVEQAEEQDPSTVRIPLSTFTNTNIPESAEFVLMEAYTGLNNLEAITDQKLCVLETRLDSLSDNTPSKSVMIAIENELEQKLDAQDLLELDARFENKADCSELSAVDAKVDSAIERLENLALEAVGGHEELIVLENKVSSLGEQFSEFSIDVSSEREQLAALASLVNMKADGSLVDELGCNISALSDKVKQNADTLILVDQAISNKADKVDLIDVDMRLSIATESLDNANIQLSALIVQFEQLKTALDNFMIKLDADAVEQNSAVTGSSLDIDYQTSFNNDLI